MGAMGGDSAHTAKPGNRRSKVYLEVMRIIAICLVVFCHMPTYTDGFGQTLESPAGWLHAVECLLARTAVPLFFMISGALLLGRRESMATVWKRRVLRIALVLACIWLVQYAYLCFAGETKFGVRTYLVTLLGMDNSLVRMADFSVSWFLYTYLFLMMFLPLLRILAQKMRNRHYIYMLALQVGLCGVLPFVYACCTGTYHVFPNSFAAPDDVLYGTFFMFMGYFVETRCFHVLHEKKWLFRLVAAVVVCSLCSVYLIQGCMHAGENHMISWSASACMATLPAIALYVLVRFAVLRLRPTPGLGRGISAVGAGVFFVMLTENLWRKLFAPWFPHEADWSLGADARAWCYVACVVGCALLVGSLLKLLPGIRRII